MIAFRSPNEMLQKFPTICKTKESAEFSKEIVGNIRNNAFNLFLFRNSEAVCIDDSNVREQACKGQVMG